MTYTPSMAAHYWVVKDNNGRTVAEGFKDLHAARMWIEETRRREVVEPNKYCKETFGWARKEVQTFPGTTVWEFQPGNGTRYKLIYTPYLRQGQAMISHMRSSAGGICMIFNTDGFLHYTYMLEKMHGIGIADAAAVLEFLRLMGHEVGMPEEGSYAPMEHISGPNRVYPTLTTGV